MLINQLFSLVPFRKTVVPRIHLRFFSDNRNNTGKHENSSNHRHFLRQSQGLRAFLPNDCPENPTIVLFPGQGSQFVGMAKSLVDIPAAKDLFDIASDVLRFL